MKRNRLPFHFAFLALCLPSAAMAADTLDRTTLPIHQPPPEAIATLDARDAKAPPRHEVKAPEGAPNVVIVTGGRPVRASTSSTVSSAAKRTSGRPQSMTA